MEEQVNAAIMESDDFDMPRQRTKRYEEMIQVNDTFYQLCNKTFEGIPEGSFLKNAEGKVITVKDLKKMIYKQDRLFQIKDINLIMSFLMMLPYAKVKDLIEHMGIPEKRHIIWNTVVV